MGANDWDVVTDESEPGMLKLIGGHDRAPHLHQSRASQMREPQMQSQQEDDTLSFNFGECKIGKHTSDLLKDPTHPAGFIIGYN